MTNLIEDYYVAKNTGTGSISDFRLKEVVAEALRLSLFEEILPSVSVGEGDSQIKIPLVFARYFANLILEE